MKDEYRISSRLKNNGKPLFWKILNKKQKNAINEISILMPNHISGIRQCFCGNKNNFRLLAERDKMGIPSNVVICKECGLISQNPYYDNEFVSIFYRDYYSILYQDYRSAEADYEDMLPGGEHIFSIIKQGVPEIETETKKVLEVGCNYGGNLVAFHSRGHICQGIDLSSAAISFGKEKGLPVDCISIYEFIENNAGDKYDIIILNHVLEHMVELEKELDAISSLLADDGYLYIGVPSIESGLPSVWYDLGAFIIFDHVYYFTKETLCNVMSLNCFRPILIKDIPGRHICSIFCKDKNFNHHININAYHDIMSFLQYAERKSPMRRLRHNVYILFLR
ncbi:MAG: class I SAM-dependent methyltransferase [Defluviitaleaceae bacterium]|nr:class I SAM-dependent methyltransferase [Defluviitaleaceae bacterium]